LFVRLLVSVSVCECVLHVRAQPLITVINVIVVAAVTSPSGGLMASVNGNDQPPMRRTTYFKYLNDIALHTAKHTRTPFN